MAMALLLTPSLVGLAILSASIALAGMTALRDPRAPTLSIALLGWGIVAVAAAIGLSPRAASAQQIPAGLARLRAVHRAAIVKRESATASSGDPSVSSRLREGLATLD